MDKYGKFGSNIDFSLRFSFYLTEMNLTYDEEGLQDIKLESKTAFKGKKF
jgi:hypothetical protein